MPKSAEKEVNGKDLYSRDNSICQLEIKGDLTVQQVKSLESEFTEALCSMTYKKVILKIVDTNTIDSPVLALCLGLYKECQHLKQEFQIHTNHEVGKIFKFTNLDRILPIEEID